MTQSSGKMVRIEWAFLILRYPMGGRAWCGMFPTDSQLWAEENLCCSSVSCDHRVRGEDKSMVVMVSWWPVINFLSTCMKGKPVKKCTTLSLQWCGFAGNFSIVGWLCGCVRFTAEVSFNSSFQWHSRRVNAEQQDGVFFPLQWTTLSSLKQFWVYSMFGLLNLALRRNLGLPWKMSPWLYNLKTLPIPLLHSWFRSSLKTIISNCHSVLARHAELHSLITSLVHGPSCASFSGCIIDSMI